MKIGVRILPDGKKRAVQYADNFSLNELKKLGIRQATKEEVKKYELLKPLFDEHKIKQIIL